MARGLPRSLRAVSPAGVHKKLVFTNHYRLIKIPPVPSLFLSNHPIPTVEIQIWVSLPE